MVRVSRMARVAGSPTITHSGRLNRLDTQAAPGTRLNTGNTVDREQQRTADRKQLRTVDREQQRTAYRKQQITADNKQQ